jgi:cytoskeletal protein CcmA (bactofilin family)
VLRGLRRFFGVGSDDDDEIGLPTAPAGSELPAPRAASRLHSSTAFRVGEKLSIKGEIAGEGDLELAGRFEGSINVRGTVVVADSAMVDADITASVIVVGGRVRGNLTSAGRVEILPQGMLTGNLRTGSFTAADGASVRGEIQIERDGKAKPETIDG